MDILPTYQSAQVPTTSETLAPTSSTPGEQPASQAPSTADAARAKRTERMNDPEWRAKYLNGDVEVRAKLRGYNQINSGATTEQRVEAVMAGAVASNQMEVTNDTDFLTTTQLASEVKHLRKWYVDQDIRLLISGEATVSPEVREEAQAAKERLMRDREFLRGYSEGRSEYVQVIKNINAYLVARVDPNKKM